MAAPNTTPFSNTQFQGWASFFGGNVQAPQPAPPSAFGAGQLGQPPANGQYTGGWAYPDAWANFYEGKQGFTAPQNQNSPAGALAATYYARNTTNPNDPNLLGWEQAYGNPQTILRRDQNWADSLGSAPTGTPSNQLTGGWQNPAAWAAFYGGDHGFTAPANAGSPASALAAAAQIAKTSSPESNPALLGWVQDFGQPGSVLANTPNWAASLGTPQVNASGQDVGQTNLQGWDSPLAWAAFYGGFQGFNQGAPQYNTLQAAKNWAGVTDVNDPSLLGWELDYGNPQTVVSALQAQIPSQTTQQPVDNTAALAQYNQQVAAFNTQQQQITANNNRIADLQRQESELQAKIKQLQAGGDLTAANYYINQLQGVEDQLGQTRTQLTALSTSPLQQPAPLGSPQTAPGFIQPPPLPPPPAYPIKYSQLPNGVSVVTQRIGHDVIEHRSDGSEWVNGKEVAFPVKGTVAHLLFNQPGSGVNVPSFGTNNVQGAGGQSGAFGLWMLPHPAGAAVGGDPFNALYNYTNTTFAQAFTAGETTGGMVPPGGPIMPLFGGKGGEGGRPGAANASAADAQFPYAGLQYPQWDLTSYPQQVPFLGVGGLREAPLTWDVSQLDRQANAAPVGVPTEGGDFFRNVDDFGRPIPDVGPPEPFSLPDFGGMETSVAQALANLGQSWIPQPTPPEVQPTFTAPDFGGLEQTIQQTLGGLLPGWTPPSAPEEQPGTFLGNVVSGLGNLLTPFNPNDPETSGINPNVTFDQVANFQSPQLTEADWGLTMPPSPEVPPVPVMPAPNGEPPVPVPPTPFFQTFDPTQTGMFLNPADLSSSAFVPASFAPPADVFTDPGFGAASLYQGGYGEPVWEAEPPEPLPPGPPLTAAETFIQKMGGKATLYQLAQSKGGDGAQQMLDNRGMLGEGAFNTPLDLSQPLEPQIKAVIGGTGVVAGKVIEAMQKEAPSAAVQQHLMDVAADAQEDKSGSGYGPAPLRGAYTTVPVYGGNNAPPSPEATAPQGPNYNPYGVRPPGSIPDVSPFAAQPGSDIPRPPADIPNDPIPDFAQGSPFAGAPNQGQGELSYTSGYLPQPRAADQGGSETWNIGPPQLRATSRTETDQGKPVSVDLSRSNPSVPLKDIMANGQVDFEAAHPGYTVEVFSAYREQAGPHGAGSPGGAMDMWIVGPDGNIIPHRGDDTTGLYAELYQYAKGYQQAVYPQYNHAFNWGGAFETWKGSGQRDLEHFDLSGGASYRQGFTTAGGYLSQFAPLQPTPTTWPGGAEQPQSAPQEAQPNVPQQVTGAGQQEASDEGWFQALQQIPANFSQFQNPSQNIEDLRSQYIPAAEPESADFIWANAGIGPQGQTGMWGTPSSEPPAGQGYGGGPQEFAPIPDIGQLLAPLQGGLGGGTIGPVLPQAMQAAEAAFNRFLPSPPSFDQVAAGGAGSIEPTFAQLTPQQLEPVSTVPSLPGGFGGFGSEAYGGAYNPPADVTAFGGGPQGGLPLMQYSSPGGGDVHGVFRTAGGEALTSSEAVDNALQESGYVQFTAPDGVGRYLTVMPDGSTANTIADLTQPNVASLAPTQRAGNLGTRLANGTYGNSALVRDYGYTGAVTSQADGYLANDPDNPPLQKGTTYTTPASTFGGARDPQPGAISQQNVGDTEYTISFPFAAAVSRAINANGGITITGPNGVTIEHVFISDIGPNMNPANMTGHPPQSTANSLNRGADLAPALYSALGVGTDGTVQIRYPGTGGAVTYSQTPTAVQLRAAGH